MLCNEVILELCRLLIQSDWALERRQRHRDTDSELPMTTDKGQTAQTLIPPTTEQEEAKMDGF